MNTIEITQLAQGRKVLDAGCGRNKFPGVDGIGYAANSISFHMQLIK